MFRHTLLLAYRSFLRFKSTFFINLIGLSTGLACVLLIYLWVSDELSVDKFHEKDSRLYQVMHNFHFPNGIQTWNTTPSPLAQALTEEMPEVEYAVAVNTFQDWFKGPGVVSQSEKPVKAKGIFATKDYFQVFSYKLIAGDKKSVLLNKKSVVISEELAKKLFSDTRDVIGKTLEWNHKLFNGSFSIAGVFKTPPSSTSQFDIIFPYGILLEADIYSDQWNAGYADTYLVLKEGTNIARFNQKITNFLRLKDSSNSKSTLFVQQYSKRYLHGHYENGVPAGGRIDYVKLISIIALFILLIACINFMNLATAKATRRIKEVGIKKAIGANRKSLIFQFLSESLLMAFLSVIGALLLVSLLLPEFNGITTKNLSLRFDAPLIWSLLGITLFTGLLSGSYPAIYLSGFQPAMVLKGKINSAIGELWARKGLVVFQFTLSIIFIVGFLVMNKQIDYTQTKNLGYNRDNIVCFSRQGAVDAKDYPAFIAELKNIPGVVNATGMARSILTDIGIRSGFSWAGQAKGDKEIAFPSPQISPDFIQTLGIEIKEGRAFSADFANEESKIILNEAAVEMMGFQDPIGKTIKYGEEEKQIIGVVKNFHYGSLHNPMEPLLFMYATHPDNILVKIQTGTEKATLEQIKRVYEKFHPKYIFEFTFMDADYQALYAAENKIASLLKYFTLLAMLISCLGLFGLAAFTAERRRKEIGVRKVLGASRMSIVYLLSSDFTKMVLVAICLALPASYLVVKHWLNNFEYRIDLQWWYFIGAGLGALLIAWFTVSTQAIKAASVNPVHSLKDE